MVHRAGISRVNPHAEVLLRSWHLSQGFANVECFLVPGTVLSTFQINSCNHHNNLGRKVLLIIIILEIRKLRPRQAEPLVQDHVAPKWPRQDLNPASLLRSPGSLNHYAFLPPSEHLSLLRFPVGFGGSVAHD